MKQAERKENAYINKPKNCKVGNDEINTEISLNNIVLAKCLKELIEEVEELQEREKNNAFCPA